MKGCSHNLMKHGAARRRTKKEIKDAKEAERIKNEASNRGSSMHSYIEKFLLGRFNLDLIDEDNRSKKMAVEIIDNGLIGESYNVGSEFELTNLDIINKICKIMDTKKPRKNGLLYKRPPSLNTSFNFAFSSVFRSSYTSFLNLVLFISK